MNAFTKELAGRHAQQLMTACDILLTIALAEHGNGREFSELEQRVAAIRNQAYDIRRCVDGLPVSL